MNFAITGEALGPSSQPPAQIAIVATYYDDPELVGKTIRPEVYATERNGSGTLGFTPDSFAVPLEGTGTWKDAYWEITNVKFDGVDVGPQAAARFVLNGKIFVTRLRYAVIRPCGANAGKNLLEAFKPRTDVNLAVGRTSDGRVRLSWPADADGFILPIDRCPRRSLGCGGRRAGGGRGVDVGGGARQRHPVLPTGEAVAGFAS